MNPESYPKYRIFNSDDELAEAVANDIFLSAKLSDHPKHISLSGGSTPKKLFSILADKFASQMPWERIHLWWGDERCVPPSDPQSNFGVVASLLLSQIKIPKGNIHRIRGEEAQPSDEANRYAQEMKAVIPLDSEGIPIFDWMLLGLGTDGHTASLFPKDIPLDFESITIHTTHPDSGQNRISLGASVLCAANHVRFLVSGKSKIPVVHQIFGNAPEASQYPSGIVSREAANSEWWLDSDAAEALH